MNIFQKMIMVIRKRILSDSEKCSEGSQKLHSGIQKMFAIFEINIMGFKFFTG
jgi:hypothetical protein